MKRVMSILLVCVMMLALFGCGNSKSVNGGKVTTVNWYLSGVNSGEEYEFVISEFNKKLTEKYNMKLDPIFIDTGNYARKMQVINAGREKYDLAFTSNWANDYYSNVSSGVLTELDTILPKYAPNLYKSLNSVTMNAIKVDGKVYAVPNWQVQAKSTSLQIPKDKLQKTGLTMDSFSKVEDLEEYLTKLKKFEPESNRIGMPWSGSLCYYYGMIDVAGQGIPGSIYFAKSGKPIIVNQYATPEYMEFLKLLRSWVEKGLLNATFSPDDKAQDKSVQKRAFNMHIYKPGVIQEGNKTTGYEWEGKQISPAVATTDGILASMTGVSVTSEQPEKALELLEILYNDKELYNLLCWGIEGQNYTKTAENTIKVKPGNKYSVSNWMVGNVSNSFLLDGQPADLWEQTKEFNEKAIVSPLLGFNPNIEKITSEIANCKTVTKENLTLLDLGLKDPVEGLSKMNEELKRAGVDKIILELQSQVDQWWELNHK